MNYHLNRDGQNLGTFPLEELRQRREAGELNGTEQVWCDGMAEWQSLDEVLGHQVTEAPPTLPVVAAATRKPHNKLMIFSLVGVGVFILGMVAVGFAVNNFLKGFHATVDKVEVSIPDLSLAERNEPEMPVLSLYSTNGFTAKEVNQMEREFRIRQYLREYKVRGERRTSYDTEALQLIKSWIHGNYGGFEGENLPPVSELGDRLAADQSCRDPLVLLIAGLTCAESNEGIKRVERAIAGFEHVPHLGYPQFYANAYLASKVSSDKARMAELEMKALEAFKDAMQDGSIRPTDHPLIADMFIEGWAYGFFRRHAVTICPFLQSLGKECEWLTHVLRGEYEIRLAWRDRGSGFSNTVSEKGWEGFAMHLASARANLTHAWELRPEYPLAPARMIYVAMGDSDMKEMRVWFERTMAVQIDHRYAWQSMRWGLRPRWYGSLNEMHKFGLSALATERFDTDVPRRYFDSLMDMESEVELPPGKRIFSDPRVWPNLQKLYEGYIAHASPGDQIGWRQTYAVVAYLAQQYEVARAQLETLQWDDCVSCRSSWGIESSLMNLEVAARTGKYATEVEKGEEHWEKGNLVEALSIYTGLAQSPDADARTKQFAVHRLAALKLERSLAGGEWVDFMPKEQADLNWINLRGKHRLLPDGALEVTSEKFGHLLFSRVRVGGDLEVRGEFEVVKSSTKSFQAGLVFGLPDFDGANWYGFRIKRNPTDNEIVSFATQWSRQQIFQPMKLNDTTNTFHFKLENEQISAWVNGSSVFTNAKPAKPITVLPQGFHVGVGAFNDMNETVIRYRNLQVRQLKGNKVAQAEKE